MPFLTLGLVVLIGWALWERTRRPEPEDPLEEYYRRVSRGEG